MHSDVAAVPSGLPGHEAGELPTTTLVALDGAPLPPVLGFSTRVADFLAPISF